MPLYDLKCPQCESLTSINLKVSEHSLIKDGKIECTKCNTPMVQHMGSAPNFCIGAKHTYNGVTKVSGGTSSSKKIADVPINIIDEKPDGGYKVTRIGKKGDIEND